MIDELEAVRRLDAPAGDPDPAARDRVRARVLDGRHPRPARRPLRRLAAVGIPLAATAAAVALVVALDGSSPDDSAPAARTGAPATAAPPPDLFPAPDEFLYVRSEGQYLECRASREGPDCKMGPPRTREIWLSERAAGRLRETGKPSRLSPLSLHLGNRRFTHDELAAYAPTGRELLRALQDGNTSGQGGGKASYPYVQLTDALREAPMPVAVRRAIIEALPLVPGVSELGPTRDLRGRPGIAFARGEDGVREEVIVDPVALTMLEERSVLLDADARPGTGFEPGDRVGGAVYEERAVVGAAGERP